MQHQVRVAVTIDPVHDLAVVRMVRHVDEEGPGCTREHRCRPRDDGRFDADGRTRIAGRECFGEGSDRVSLDAVARHDEYVEVAGAGDEVSENG